MKNKLLLLFLVCSAISNAQSGWYIKSVETLGWDMMTSSGLAYSERNKIIWDWNGNGVPVNPHWYSNYRDTVAAKWNDSTTRNIYINELFQLSGSWVNALNTSNDADADLRYSGSRATSEISYKNGWITVKPAYNWSSSRLTTLAGYIAPAYWEFTYECSDTSTVSTPLSSHISLSNGTHEGYRYYRFFHARYVPWAERGYDGVDYNSYYAYPYGNEFDIPVTFKKTGTATITIKIRQRLYNDELHRYSGCGGGERYTWYLPIDDCGNSVWEELKVNVSGVVSVQEPVDTVIVIDSPVVAPNPPYVETDTIYVRDTIYINDTILVPSRTVHDTVYIHDTIASHSQDTIYLRDPYYKIDTIHVYINDTIHVEPPVVIVDWDTVTYTKYDTIRQVVEVWDTTYKEKVEWTLVDSFIVIPKAKYVDSIVLVLDTQIVNVYDTTWHHATKTVYVDSFVTVVKEVDSVVLVPKDSIVYNIIEKEIEIPKVVYDGISTAVSELEELRVVYYGWGIVIYGLVKGVPCYIYDIQGRRVAEKGSPLGGEAGDIIQSVLPSSGTYIVIQGSRVTKFILK